MEDYVTIPDGIFDLDLEDEIVQDIINKKNQIEKEKQVQQRETEKRIKTITTTFLRMSWKHKKSFICKLLTQINNLDAIFAVVSYFKAEFGKMSAYADASPNTSFAYDKILMDHDRTMDEETLCQTVNEFVDWFGSSLESLDQIELIVDLMRAGGGGIVRKLYIPVMKFYNEKLVENSAVESNFLNEVEDVTYEDESYDKSHPCSVEVENLRKKYNALVSTYRRQVLGNMPKRKDDKNDPISKNNKKSKKKENKKSKKGKKPDEIDWIEMLPVWIVKQIFNYLDQKTLTKIKKVNTYWAYIASSVTKDRKARKQLDAAMQKIRTQLRSEPDKFIPIETTKDTMENVNPDRRMTQLLIRGAIREDMRPKIEETELLNDSLLNDVNKDSLIYPNTKLQTFPRFMRNDLLLYRTHTCPIKDIDVDINNDLTKLRESLNNSLSEKVSTVLSISVRELALDE